MSPVCHRPKNSGRNAMFFSTNAHLVAGVKPISPKKLLAHHFPAAQRIFPPPAARVCCTACPISWTPKPRRHSPAGCPVGEIHPEAASSSTPTGSLQDTPATSSGRRPPAAASGQMSAAKGKKPTRKILRLLWQPQWANHSPGSRPLACFPFSQELEVAVIITEHHAQRISLRLQQ